MTKQSNDQPAMTLEDLALLMQREFLAIHEKIDETAEGVRTELGDRMNALSEELGGKIDALDRKLGVEIGERDRMQEALNDSNRRLRTVEAKTV